MRVSAFDFDLPEDLIALRPAVPRDSARLLVVREDGQCEHREVRDLPALLQAGDILAVNNSKVFPARLRGRRPPRPESGSAPVEIEAMLHKRIAPDRFLALVRPAKRLRQGDVVKFGEHLDADVVARREGGEVDFRFSQEGAALDAAITQEGQMPLPPYIANRRQADTRDIEDYQTFFAKETGSVAAPTAGLHFTPDLLSRLNAAGVSQTALTLHVGAGTFLPVSTEDTADHRMHSEWAEIDVDVARRLNDARARGGRIAAVGTTCLRTLETAADPNGLVQPFRGETDIFITPGYRFKTAEILLTNFHLPRSTLFMLVCAFMETEIMRKVYKEAVRERYRFYSYGDACLLFRRRND